MSAAETTAESAGEVLVYVDSSGETRVQVRLQEGTVWLSQAQMAELYGTTPQNITQHTRAIYAEGEQREGATCKSYLQVRREGGRDVRRSIKHYNLTMILAVGFRVRSPIGTRFRQWASEVLTEYVVKGFAMDDARPKAGPQRPPGPFPVRRARIAMNRSGAMVTCSQTRP